MSTRLIADFVGGTPIEEIAANRDSFERWMEIGGVLGKGNPRPVISVTVTVGRFEHLGQAGILTLTFFKGRLQKATFYPSDMPRYLQSLSAQGTDLSPKGGSPLVPGVSVARGICESGLYRGSEFVCWSDGSLDEEERCWEKQNTSLLDRLLGR